MNTNENRASERLLWGFVAHLIADWLFQSDWMAANKSKPGHPAGIVHAAFHVVALAFVFPMRWALLLGVVHYVIDLRFILRWWRSFYRQTTNPANPASMHVAIWGDQVCHIVSIAIVAAVLARKPSRRRESH